MNRLEVMGFINGFWLNSLDYKNNGIVIEPNIIECKGEHLKIVESSLNIKVGTPVVIYYNRNLYFETLDEFNKRENERKRLEQAEKDKQRYNSIKLRLESEEFNNQLYLPVKWTTNYKRVLHELSERSTGTGINNRSVVHIQLLEDLEDGRLKRKAGNFLCTSNSKDDGKLFYFNDLDNGKSYDFDGKCYLPKVSCTHCLSLAERFLERKGNKLDNNMILEPSSLERHYQFSLF